MALRAHVAGRLTAGAARQDQALGSLGLDWLMIAASSWWLGGIYLDGWAHQHGKVDQSFFTPWHGVLYSGFAIGAAVVLGTLVRNRQRGYGWSRALPRGYGLSLLGVLLFALGGQGDLIWHTLFGIESGVDALLSPSHLLLASGALLFMFGPLRAGWARPGTPRGWRGWLPPLLSLAFGLSVMTFITAYAHPLIDVWPARDRQPAPRQDPLVQPTLIDADGTAERWLRLPWQTGSDYAPAPDGRRLALVAGVGSDVQLYSVGLDGSAARQLTSGLRAVSDPSWSPDGRQLVFAAGPSKRQQLYIVNADGSGMRQLGNDPAGVADPAWSPDGTRIVFTSARGGNNDLFVIGVDGTGETRLTSSPAEDGEAAWSPDGARLAFVSNRDLMRRVFVMNSDGSDQRRLLADEIDGRSPAWSADGAWIAFVASLEGNNDVYVAASDGSGLRNVTAQPALEEGRRGLAWAGERLLFSTQGRDMSAGGNFFPQAIGVSGVLLQSALLIGLLLLALRRWPLPPGALTLLVAINAALMSVLDDQYFLLPALLAGAALGDLLLWRLRPSLERPWTLRSFAAAAPMLIYAAYFATIALRGGSWWTIHLLAGTVVLAGVVGLLLSYLLLPPALPDAPPAAR